MCAPVNVVANGHRTSLRQEPVARDALRDMAAHYKIGLDEMVTRIDGDAALGII